MGIIYLAILFCVVVASSIVWIAPYKEIRKTKKKKTPKIPSEKIKDIDKLAKWFKDYECCPDCLNDRFYEGPQGGAATNIKCTKCGSEFNVCPPEFVERIN
jgi:hypothetical protein